MLHLFRRPPDELARFGGLLEDAQCQYLTIPLDYIVCKEEPGAEINGEARSLLY